MEKKKLERLRFVYVYLKKSIFTNSLILEVILVSINGATLGDSSGNELKLG